MKDKKYIGPSYSKSISWPDVGTVMPASWDQKRIAEMCKKHPRLRQYFETVEGEAVAKKPATTTTTRRKAKKPLANKPK